jgi:RNA polymerase sigma-70 factor (ECF subfamily)
LDAFREQRTRLWGFTMRSLGNAETAEDLLQETFLRAWDHRKQLEGDPDAGAARRFLWRITRNLVIDEIRMRVRSRVHESDAVSPDESPSVNPGPAADVEHADCVRAVRETVDRLTNRRTRRCLQLWLEGRSIAEIAKEAGIAVGQVRGRIQRGKAMVIERAGNRLAPPPREDER